MKINQFIQEADKQEKIKGFDAKTAQFMADLRLRYPNAPDALSALVKAVQQLRDASWGKDKEHSAEITKNGKTIDELEDIIDELELRIAGMEIDDEENDMRERQLTPGEKRSREANVKKLKKHNGDFEKRYGKDAESVMYAVATKRAKGESVNEAHQINWPYEDMEDHAYNAIRHGMHAYDAFGHVYSMAKDTYQRDWLQDNKDDIIKMFASYGLQTESAEKRWKQTSMSPEAAAKEFGKENVRVKKGALRNGDDMVEVFVEGYYELPPIDRDRYQKRDGLEGPIPTRSGKVVYYDEKEGMYYDPDTDMYISYDDFRKLDQENMHKVDKMKQESKSNNKDQLSEGVLDDTDEDGWMAKSQLYKMAKYAIKLHAMIQDTDNLEPWIQAKITRASEDMSSVKHYLEYQEMNPHHQEMPAQGPVEEDMDDVDEHKQLAMHLNQMAMQDDADDGMDADYFRDIARAVMGHDIKEIRAAILDGDTEPRERVLDHINKMHPGIMKEIFPRDTRNPGGYLATMREADERHYMCVHAKKGTMKCTASSSYEAAKKAAAQWKMNSTAGIDAHLMDEPKTATEGHSPHKKGTAKYKKHMAAMHAESAEQQLEKQAIDFFTSIKSKINTTGKK